MGLISRRYEGLMRFPTEAGALAMAAISFAHFSEGEVGKFKPF